VSLKKLFLNSYGIGSSYSTLSGFSAFYTQLDSSSISAAEHSSSSFFSSIFLSGSPSNVSFRVADFLYFLWWPFCSSSVQSEASTCISKNFLVVSLITSLSELSRTAASTELESYSELLCERANYSILCLYPDFSVIEKY
jgi:hypothetical protein